MGEERRQKINDLIQSKGDVTVAEIKSIIDDVSDMTIRRDLNQLEKEGWVVRTRGGAKSLPLLSAVKETEHDLRMVENAEGKQIIAEKALQFIAPGRSIYIDSGTTCLFFAQKLNSTNLFVTTPAPDIGLELAKNGGIQVTLTGGFLEKDTLTMSGTIALQAVRSLNIDIAFIGTSAFSLDSGFTCGHAYNADLKRLIIKKARQSIVLMDCNKMDYNMLYTFAKLSDIDALIVDQELPEKIIKAAKRAGVTVI